MENMNQMNAAPQYNNKMKICKVCGNPVAKNAKRCPNCGAKLKRGWIIPVIVIVILLIFLAAGSKPSQKESPAPVNPNDVGSGESTPGTEQTDASNTEEAALNYEITNTIFSVYKPEYSDSYRYDALIEIENKGTQNIYLTSRQFDIEDNDGHLIQTDDLLSCAPDVILPGEKGYLYNQFGTSLESVSDPNSVKLAPHFTVKTTNITPHEYPVTDTSVRDDMFGKTVVGRVTNDTEDEVSYLYISVLYYNSNGQCVGVSGTSLTEIAPDETKSFEISGIGAPNGYDGDLADYKVIAREMFIGL